MTTTAEYSGSGVSLAELAGDFGESEDQPAPSQTRAEPAEAPAEDSAEAEPEPTESEAETAPRRRRGARPASEHAKTARDAVTSAEGVAGWRSPSFGEAMAEQDEAIHQWSTLWWRVPRSVQAVAYLTALAGLIGLARLLARTRYILTALVLSGAACALWAWWGVGA